jgi:copper chaperone
MAQTIELNVTGMTCDHCVHAVTEAVSQVEGVDEVKVSLDEKSAVVRGGQFDVAHVIAAIEEEGYEAAVR